MFLVQFLTVTIDVPRAGVEPARPCRPRDFKSLVSHTTIAFATNHWHCNSHAIEWFSRQIFLNDYLWSGLYLNPIWNLASKYIKQDSRVSFSLLPASWVHHLPKWHILRTRTEHILCIISIWIPPISTQRRLATHHVLSYEIVSTHCLLTKDLSLF